MSFKVGDKVRLRTTLCSHESCQIGSEGLVVWVLKDSPLPYSILFEGYTDSELNLSYEPDKIASWDDAHNMGAWACSADELEMTNEV